MIGKIVCILSITSISAQYHMPVSHHKGLARYYNANEKFPIKINEDVIARSGHPNTMIRRDYGTNALYEHNSKCWHNRYDENQPYTESEESSEHSKKNIKKLTEKINDLIEKLQEQYYGDSKLKIDRLKKIPKKNKNIEDDDDDNIKVNFDIPNRKRKLKYIRFLTPISRIYSRKTDKVDDNKNTEVDNKNKTDVEKFLKVLQYIYPIVPISRRQLEDKFDSDHNTYANNLAKFLKKDKQESIKAKQTRSIFDKNGMLYLTKPKDMPEKNLGYLMNKVWFMETGQGNKGALRHPGKVFNHDEIKQIKKIARSIYEESLENREDQPDEVLELLQHDLALRNGKDQENLPEENNEIELEDLQKVNFPQKAVVVVVHNEKDPKSSKLRRTLVDDLEKLEVDDGLDQDPYENVDWTLRGDRNIEA